MSEKLVLKFSFNGGLADEHRLDFYEAARFQYGAARLIYTVDRYIETKKVPSRVSPRAISSRYRIAPAAEGSWEQEIFQNIAIGAAGSLVAAPIVYGFAYVYRLLFPAAKRAEEAASLLDNLNSGADANEIRMFLEANNASQENELINLCINKVSQANEREMQSPEIAQTLKSLMQLKDQRLKATQFENMMGGINFEDSQSLIKKTRTQISEIGYPLSKSADSLNISDAANDNPTLYTLSHKDVVSLSSNIYEDNLSVLTVIIKSFDKETGWGKLRVFAEDGSDEVFSFLVRRRELANHRNEVLEAMKDKKIIINGFRVLTPAKTLKYVIFNEHLSTLGSDGQSDESF